MGRGEARAAQAHGRLRGYSPLSRVVGLESLALAARGKLAGWRSLQRLQSRLSAIDPAALPRLCQRAETQLEQLEVRRLDAVAEAFPAPAAG